MKGNRGRPTLPPRPLDLSRQCWRGACDDCIDGKSCHCDCHVTDPMFGVRSIPNTYSEAA